MEMDRKTKRIVAIVLAVLAIVTTIIIISVVANNNDNNMSDSISENLSSESSTHSESIDLPTSDTKLINTINSHLDEYVKENGNIDYFYEVVDVLNENNISLDSLTSSSDNLNYLYDSYLNQFVLMKDEKIVFPSSYKIENKAYFYKLIYNDEDLSSFKGYSFYITKSYEKDSIDLNNIANIESEKNGLNINITDNNSEGSFALIGNFNKVNIILSKAKITIFKQVNELSVVSKSSVDIYALIEKIVLNEGIINVLTGAKIDTIDATNATSNSKVNKSKSSEINKIISNNNDICNDKSIIINP